MIWTVFAILLALWLFGLVTAHTFGGLIHILLLLAVLALLYNFIPTPPPHDGDS
jgi:hypothetical protein